MTEYYNIEQLTHEIGRSKSRIRQLIQNGELQGEYVHGSWRVPKESLLAYMNKPRTRGIIKEKIEEIMTPTPEDIEKQSIEEPIIVEPENKPEQPKNVIKDNLYPPEKDPEIAEAEKKKELALLKRDTDLIEANIKDIATVLKLKIEYSEKIEQLSKDYVAKVDALELEHKNKMDELQKREETIAQKEIAQIKRDTDLNNRDRAITERESNLKKSWQDLNFRQSALNDQAAAMDEAQKTSQQEAERKKTTQYQIDTSLKEITSYLDEIAEKFAKSGKRKLANSIEDDIESVEQIKEDAGEDWLDSIVQRLRMCVEDCNTMAVRMYRANEKQIVYKPKTIDFIVESLDEIYKLCPALKPEYLPQDIDIEL